MTSPDIKITALPYPLPQAARLALQQAAKDGGRAVDVETAKLRDKLGVEYTRPEYLSQAELKARAEVTA